MDGLTDAERGRERRGLRTKEILISLRQHLKIEKDKEPVMTTPYQHGKDAGKVCMGISR